MKKFKQFTTPVNQAGLPIAWETREPQGSENLIQLSAHQVAQVYWLIKSVRVQYSFSLDGHIIKRDFTLESDKTPIERILGPAVLHYSHTQNRTVVTHQAELDLYNINHHLPFNNTYCMPFLLFEYDDDTTYELSFDMNKNMEIIDKKDVTILGQKLELLLQTDNRSGVIHQAEVEFSFYHNK